MCIKALEADIAKLNSGWVKVKYFLTRKSTDREKQIKEITETKSDLIAKKKILVTDLATLSSCKFVLFNSANPHLLKESANELSHQPRPSCRLRIGDRDKVP